VSTPRALPEPSFVQRAPLCLRCGYNLQGLAPPGACPECGLAFEAGQLILAGIPRHATQNTPVHQRILWGVFVVMSVLFGYTWGFIVMRYPWFAFAWCGALIGCFVWLIATSQRERSGYERFAITRGGVARLPFKMKEGETNIDSVFVPFGNANAFTLQRVGPFWKRLIVGTRGPDNTVINPVFDAGFRCADEHTQTVHDALTEAMNSHGSRVPQATPLR
jgi:hypothetical protein